jgi:stage V sporulation protein D (sporulation-specific penicillin-binding protein)
MRSQVVFRARLLCAFFIIAAILLVVRLYLVQIVHGEEYRAAAMGQYVETSVEENRRGAIYFSKRDGTPVAAAVMQSGWRVAIVPEDIESADSAYAALSAVAEIDRERFTASAAKKQDPYEEVAFRLDDTAAQTIRSQKIPGVLLVRDQWRSYPAEGLAAQAIGFVGYKGDRRIGLYGLERQWQDTLQRSDAGLYVNPFAEIFTNIGALISQDPASREGNIVTTIEPVIQAQLEETLDQVRDAYSPRIVGGIIMDPHTGEIVAIANRPAFDPNTYNTVTDQKVFQNQLIEGRYELGSIMKPLTVAAGIDAGAVTRASTYHDAGCITRSTKKICNHDGKARNTVPLQEILNQSLNLGVTFVADRMGHEVFTDYMRRFGFGEKTGVDLPNEVTGDISTLGDGGGPEVNYAAASFGQGVSVSPIAMTRALSTLAGGGKLPTPYVVKAVKYDSGIVREIDHPEPVQVLKPETADEVTAMLVAVFDDALLGGKLKQAHYSIAAKTGTAQMAQPGGGYYDDRYLHSFFGYFPAHEPRFIVFLFAVEPRGAEFASATLAEPFLDVAKFVINYYDIPPDR